MVGVEELGAFTQIGAFWVKAIVRLDTLSWVAVQELEGNGFP
jgi:hypothetical protein